MILQVHESSSLPRCERVLRQGGLLGLPTETVYGLAADADKPEAVAAIFSTKGRPADHPLIVHVADRDGGLSGARYFAQEIPEFAMRLMQAFWPGPLTLILPRRAGVAAAAAGGQDSVGLRCPAHPAAQALLRALRHSVQGGVVWGLAAPSANRFGRVSPTTAQHVHSEFNAGRNADDPATLLILDGGPCEVGIESTIVDCTRGTPVLLRPGAIGLDALAQACGQAIRLAHDMPGGQTAPRASGTLAAHYAPDAKVRLMETAALQQALQPDSAQRQAVAGRIGVYMRTRPGIASSEAARPHKGSAAEAPQLLLRAMAQDPARAAQHLFATLRALDDAGAEEIWVEATPQSMEWAGVADRLQRASVRPSQGLEGAH